MISFDWTAVMSGLAVGSVVGTVFFVGLAFGIRLALRTQNPIRILTFSVVLRIAALLGIGWIVLGQGGPWAAFGYGAAFFVVRFIVTTFARIGSLVGDAS
ncbi:N-ATPase subunit AtpR [Octadecabacter antarcticus]|uniref:N-ATPase subunit AtpR n=1 Tax=Octadecabacter antarcticus TaxID=1217908 RepID=UPI0001807228|nr:ATP synthase subunit I [Octadecabacter antarcticus]